MKKAIVLVKTQPTNLFNDYKNYKSMLNEQLINPKDLEIAKLKRTIADFKEYDSKRKQYYASLGIEVGKLKAYIEKLESEKGDEKLRKKLKEQRQQLAVFHAKKFLDKFEMKDIQAIVTANKMQLQQQIDAKNKEIKELKLIRDRLLAKLNANNIT